MAPSSAVSCPLPIANYPAVLLAHGGGGRLTQQLVAEVFEVCDRAWRGIGVIPRSGYRLRGAYERFDAEKRFAVQDVTTRESPLCIAGEILRGNRKPHECGAFGARCTPEHPLGAPMVSSEGACAAYWTYKRDA